MSKSKKITLTDDRGNRHPVNSADFEGVVRRYLASQYLTAMGEDPSSLAQSTWTPSVPTFPPRRLQQR